MGPIIAAIQKQQAKKKTSRLSKNNISEPMWVVVHNYINFAGVQAYSAKIIVTSLSTKSKYDPKTLSNMTELYFCFYETIIYIFGNLLPEFFHKLSNSM